MNDAFITLLPYIILPDLICIGTFLVGRRGDIRMETSGVHIYTGTRWDRATDWFYEHFVDSPGIVIFSLMFSWILALPFAMDKGYLIGIGLVIVLAVVLRILMHDEDERREFWRIIRITAFSALCIIILRYLTPYALLAFGIFSAVGLGFLLGHIVYYGYKIGQPIR